MAKIRNLPKKIPRRSLQPYRPFKRNLARKKNMGARFAVLDSVPEEEVAVTWRDMR